MGYSVINKVSAAKVPDWGNTHQFIAIHYLGCVGENYDLAADGCGAHYTVYWDGRIYQRCAHNAVPWAVGTAGYYKQKHPKANNYNTISIEMCCKCDGNSQSADDPYWYFTEETQKATVWLVQKLMKELDIPIENVLRHYDIVNKVCPAPYVHNNKYKTTWTWDEFKAKVTGSNMETPAINYYTRKTWEDEKTQFAAYSSKEVAIAYCPVGYTVFDKNGKVIYTNKEKESDSNVDKIWMGWVKRETGSAGLRCIHGDAGKAYGLQFDYRYGLIPFLKYCVAYNPERYSGFNPYIALGVGNSKLIYNVELGKLWQQYYDSYTAEFERLQYTCAYQQYYLPAKEYVLKHYKLDMDKFHPAVKGTLWSMSFRSGTQTGAMKFAGCAGKTDEQILNSVYPTYGNNDDGRWTRAGQWGDALTALKNNTYASVYKEMQKSESEENDTKVEEKKTETTTSKMYIVQCGAFAKESNAKKQVSDLKKKGFEAIVKKRSNDFSVQCGAFKEKKNADELIAKLKKAGFSAILKYQ